MTQFEIVLIVQGMLRAAEICGQTVQECDTMGQVLGAMKCQKAILGRVVEINSQALVDSRTDQDKNPTMGALEIRQTTTRLNKL